jgi:hypothetical protein
MELAISILRWAGVKISAADTLRIMLLYGGGLRNPDGSVAIRCGGKEIVIFLEIKTWRRQLDIDQIRGHIQTYLTTDQSYLWIITSDKNDRLRLACFKDKRIVFSTWQDIHDRLYQMSHTIDNSKDKFILEQFVELLETTDDAWMARMISEELIKVHSEHLLLAEKEQSFRKECSRLMHAIKDDVIRPFNSEIASGEIQDHYGRLGVECELEKRPLDQWLFFGTYLETSDHQIEFKVPNQPEFAIFFDINPIHRARLAALVGLDRPITALKNAGFEFNFPENRGNRWRVFYWRETMQKYVGSEIGDLAQLFQGQLRKIFESQFYKIARDANVEET